MFLQDLDRQTDRIKKEKVRHPFRESRQADRDLKRSLCLQTRLIFSAKNYLGGVGGGVGPFSRQVKRKKKERKVRMRY